MVSGLAYYLSMKINHQMTPNLKMIYDDELTRALNENGQRTSLYISPKTYYPGT
jgi:spore coat protein CotF